MDERQPPAAAPETPSRGVANRTILKFDSGRRGFTRAIVTLVASAVGLLAFALYFFWNLL